MIKLFKNTLILALILSALFVYRVFLWRFSGLLVKIINKIVLFSAFNERKLAEIHLFQSFPEKSVEDRNKIIRQMSHHLAVSLIECLELWRKPEGILNKIEFSDGSREILDNVLSKNRGVIIASGHIGNWELMAAKLSQHTKVNTLVKNSYDKRLDNVVSDFRSSYGINTISRTSDTLKQQIEDALSNGEVLGILMDQDTKVKGCFVPFFDKPAFTPTGPASLAMKYDAPLLVAYTHRKHNKHVIYVSETIEVNYAADKNEEIRRLTAKATAILEQAIRQEPSQWVWFHKRWKTQPVQNDKTNQNE